MVLVITLLFVGTIVVPRISGIPVYNEEKKGNNSSSEWRYPPDIIVPDDYPTIQQAINNTTQGSCIGVRNGTYNETISINKDDIILEGDLTIETIINGVENTTITIIGNNVTITDFSITFNITGSADGGGIEFSGNYSKILNNKINGYGRPPFAIKSNGSEYITISNNKIWTNSNETRNYMTGINLITCFHFLISNNKIYNCMIGIDLGFCTARPNWDAIIKNNKITQNNFGIRLYFTMVFIMNNEISNNIHGIESVFHSKPLVKWNNITNNTLTFDFLLSTGIIVHNNIVNENAEILVNMSFCFFVRANGNYWGQNFTFFSPRHKCYSLFAPIILFPWRVIPQPIEQSWPD
jgi:hypothetical protein